MFMKCLKSVCASTVVSPISYSINFFSSEDHRNIEEDTDDTEPAHKGGIQVEY
jgi:hypothetical protein